VRDAIFSDVLEYELQKQRVKGKVSIWLVGRTLATYADKICKPIPLKSVSASDGRGGNNQSLANSPGLQVERGRLTNRAEFHAQSAERCIEVSEDRLEMLPPRRHDHRTREFRELIA
jgi:hypothetical protein